MKIAPQLAGLVIALSLSVGCDTITDDTVTYNQAALATNGEEIGTLPDGRIVRKYTVVHDRPGVDQRHHFIYVVEGGASVSANHDIPVGKTRINTVEVIIDGVQYVPKPAPAAE